MTPIDLIAILVIGDMFTGIASDKEAPVWHLLVILPFWSFLVYLVEVITNNKKIQRKVEGEPVVIIRHGKIDEEVMDQYRLNKLEIEMKLRQQGIFNINEVEIAYLEVNGEITAKQKNE